jgi:hypothetical protein
MIDDSWDEMTGTFNPDHFRDVVVPSLRITHVLDQEFQEEGSEEHYYPMPVEDYLKLR